MRAAVIVVIAPGFDGRPRLGQAEEYMLVKSFVAQAAVEGLDEGVLHGFARRDVAPVEPPQRPAQHRRTDQLAAVIADNHFLSINDRAPRQDALLPRLAPGQTLYP